MKINLAIIISSIVLLIGLFTGQLYLWIPATVLVAGIIDLFTRQWVKSDRLGEAQTFSIILKLSFAIIGFYAMVGQVLSIILLFWWFVF